MTDLELPMFLRQVVWKYQSERPGGAPQRFVLSMNFFGVRKTEIRTRLGLT